MCVCVFCLKNQMWKHIMATAQQIKTELFVYWTVFVDCFVFFFCRFEIPLLHKSSLNFVLMQKTNWEKRQKKN